MKQTLKIVIEKSSDFYGAYADNCPGVYASAGSVEEVKKDILVAIELIKETQGDKTPAILNGDYSIVYRFDVQSLLNYYSKFLSFVALEALTGINQKQLCHYAAGAKKPRLQQREKIEQALHAFGCELMAVEL